MAIVKGIFSTLLKGRVGLVTYRNRNGKNIVSSRAATVKNPRTMSQQIQRMRMKTVMAAYSAMSEICDHSFEGVTSGSASQGKFMSENLLALMGQRYYNLKENPTILPNNYIVSKGTLPDKNATSLSRPVEAINGAAGIEFKSSLYDRIISLATQEGKSLITITTQELCDALGINIGDQLTFVAVMPLLHGNTYTAYGMTQRESFCFYSRIIFDPEKASTPAFIKRDGLDTGIAAINPEALTAESKNYINLYFSQTDKAFILTDVNADEIDAQSIAGGCIILSRKENNKWKRSNATMLVYADNPQKIGDLEDCVRTYNPNDPMYLNNAED